MAGPATEAARGRASRVSTRRLQLRLTALLTQWAGARGEVRSDWPFYNVPRADRPSRLVPEVAYASFARLPLCLGELRDHLAIAPDIAVEFVSAADSPVVLQQKVAVYFGAGGLAVIAVDPLARTIAVYDGPAASRTFVMGDCARARGFADLRLDVAALFGDA
jgi:Uma2 family endonuclease